MNRSNSIVKQASILAIAGILVRIIGVLYKSPLKALIGAEGVGYYGQAHTIYAVILLISSYSIPTAISKLISEKLVLNQYNNAQKILKCSFIYIFVIGGSAAIVTFFIAPFVSPHQNAIMALRVLCPTIFLSGLLGVLRGYFQAYQTTLYTSISQIVEQIFNAIVSVGAAYILIQPYLNTQGSAVASIGAAGGAIGTGVGVLVSLIYMTFMYLKRKNNLIIKNDADDYEDSYKTIFKTILNIVTPIIFATCIYNLISVVDMYLFYFAMGKTKVITEIWGVYQGEFLVLQNVPIALASAMATASIPAISSSWSTRNIRQTKEHIQSGIRITMLILIPAAIGMTVLAYPIVGTIFPQEKTIMLSTLLLAIGSPSIVVFGLSTVTNGVLQALGEVKAPVRNSGIALIFHCIITVLMLYLTPLGIYSLVISNSIYGLQVCYLNNKVLQKKLHYKQEKKLTFILPLLASIFMAIVVAGTYYALFTLTRKVFIPLVISIIIGIIVYFAIILYIYADKPEEIDSIPYAKKIIYKFKKR